MNARCIYRTFFSLFIARRFNYGEPRNVMLTVRYTPKR